MRKLICIMMGILVSVVVSGCSAGYKATPLAFKTPAAYANSQTVAGATVAAMAYDKVKEAKEAFGFDVRAAGMLPVQVVFDNQGGRHLKINPRQTFLEDSEGNLWPILEDKTAYERATRYATTNKVFKEGAYGGFLGATAGALVGAAVGIVSGDNVAEAAGKGAAVGAAAGGTLGGAKGYDSSRHARNKIIDDLEQKSLENKEIPGVGLAFGFLFFPGEAKDAMRLRMQVQEGSDNTPHNLVFELMD